MKSVKLYILIGEKFLTFHSFYINELLYLNSVIDIVDIDLHKIISILAEKTSIDFKTSVIFYANNRNSIDFDKIINELEPAPEKKTYQEINNIIKQESSAFNEIYSKVINFMKEANYHYNNDNFDAAIELYQKSCDLGYEEAFLKLNSIFRYVLQTELNSSKAIKLYKTANNNGLLLKEYDDFINLTPKRIEFDELFLYFGKKAHSFEKMNLFFNKITSSEYMYLLGYDYFNGNEITQNYDKALYWIEKSALMGNIHAIYSIGNVFKKQFYVENCFEKNIDYFKQNWIKIKNKSTFDNDKFVIKYLKYVKKSYILNELGEYYSNNKLITANYKIAIKYFKKAIKMNFTQAMNNLANCYFNGYGVVKNDEKAFKLLNKSAKLGNIEAIYKTAICYENGFGIVKNYKKAIKLFEKAIKSGCTKSENRLKIIKNECDISKIKYIKGISEYIYKEANNYFLGKGIVQNYKKAFELYLIGVKFKNHTAINCVGFCYENGYGVIQNNEKALKYYKKSADMGNTLAMCHLGKIYYYGIGINKDITKALEFYEKSADLNNGLAMNFLGNYYFFVLNNYEKGIKLYEKATKFGSKEAQKTIDAIKFQGDVSKIKYITGIEEELYKRANYFLFIYDETKKNYSRAVKLYFKAVELGHNGAMNCLGYCYQNGYGVIQNDEKAFEYYKKSADLGNSYAIYNLAKIYFYGIGINKSIKTALALFEKSADLKNTLAMNFLGEYFYGNNEINKAKHWFELSSQYFDPKIIDLTNQTQAQMIYWGIDEVCKIR